MAEATKTEIAETVSASEVMEVENLNGGDTSGNGESKRPREEGPGKEPDVDDSKKQKIEEKAEGGDGEGGVAVTVSLGPKSFGSGVDMFDYFFKFLHHWPTNLDVNEYERMVLLDLIKKGHPEPDKKIGGGVGAFQVRFHPTFKSKCYFLIRDDEVVDDFSFRKCVGNILPLPENMKGKSDVDRALGGGRGHGGRGGHRGRGRKGRY